MRRLASLPQQHQAGVTDTLGVRICTEASTNTGVSARHALCDSARHALRLLPRHPRTRPLDLPRLRDALTYRVQGPHEATLPHAGV